MPRLFFDGVAPRRSLGPGLDSMLLLVVADTLETPGSGPTPTLKSLPLTLKSLPSTLKGHVTCVLDGESKEPSPATTSNACGGWGG